MALTAPVRLSSWTALLVLVGLAAPLAALEVRLRPEVQVAAPWAVLEDVAELNGPADELAAVRRLPVAALRARAVTVGLREIRRALADTALAKPAVISGSCQVRQPLRTITADALISAASAALIQPGDDAEAICRRPPGSVAIADDGSEPVLLAIPLDRPRTGQIPVRIEIRRSSPSGSTTAATSVTSTGPASASGDELARALVVLDLHRYQTVATLAVAVRKGAPIAPGDLRLERVPLKAGPVRTFSDPSQAVGRVALRDLAEGTPLTTDLVQEPPAVRSGEEVTLSLQRGEVALCAVVTALGSGRVGERIAVRRPGDSRSQWAVVTGPGQVAPDGR